MWHKFLIYIVFLVSTTFVSSRLNLRSISNHNLDNLHESFHQPELNYDVQIERSHLIQDHPNENKSNYSKIINLLSFYGHWYSNDHKTKTFGLFANDGGYIEVSSPYSDAVIEDATWNVEFYFFDGEYQDQRYIKIKVKEAESKFEFDKKNATFQGTGFIFEVTYGNNRKPYTIKDCITDVKVSFIDLKDFSPLIEIGGKEAEDVGLWVSFNSEKCSLALSSRILKISDIITQELVLYVLVMISSAIIGTVSVNKLVANFPENINKLAKISLWSIWLINAWDFYLFLYHIALSVGMSGWLMIVALAFFFLSIINQAKLVYAIYVSTHHAQLNSNISAGCKFFAIYYGLLYFLVFSYTYMTSFIWIILTSSFFLVPQIILIYQRGRKYKFNYWHLLGLSATKISFVLYIKAYPNNIFKLSPDFEFTSVYFGIILYQVLILFVQKIFPKFCLTPKPYKYLVSVVNPEEKEEMCPICMEALKEELPNSLLKPLLGSVKKSEKEVVVMQTPCKHRYHESCLTEWMKNKLECPSCRQIIPSLNNEDP